VGNPYFEPRLSTFQGNHTPPNPRGQIEKKY
jgi:hypothetical protein